MAAQILAATTVAITSVIKGKEEYQKLLAEFKQVPSIGNFESYAWHIADAHGIDGSKFENYVKPLYSL